MLEITVWVNAFTKSLPRETLGQPIRIVLVKVLTFITLHTQIPEPVSTDKAMFTFHRCGTIGSKISFSAQARPPERILCVDLSFEIETHAVHC
jgi:hypothetical protein